MADVDPDTIDYGKPLTLGAMSTNAGFLETVMLHETISPQNDEWNKDEALTAMRLMRQVIENRARHPQAFGAGKIPPGPSAEIPVLMVRDQYAAFADAPNFPALFIAPVAQIMSGANNPKSPFYADYRVHVRKAIRAATEPMPPANLIVRNLYYWRTKDHGSPAHNNKQMQKIIHPYKTVQNNTFWTEDRADLS